MNETLRDLQRISNPSFSRYCVTVGYKDGRTDTHRHITAINSEHAVGKIVKMLVVDKGFSLEKIDRIEALMERDVV